MDHTLNVKAVGSTPTRSTHYSERVHVSKERARLSKIRMRRSVELKDLADAMGVKPSHLRANDNKYIEAVTIDTLMKYVQALGGEIQLVFEFYDKRFVYRPVSKDDVLEDIMA